MSTNTNNDTNHHSAPIPISHSRARPRSASVSSASSGSASSTFEPPTPPSGNPSQRVTIPSPGSSPILSYFFAQSPTKTPATGAFSFKRKFGTTPVFEADESEREVPVASHARRASASVASRFTQQPQAQPLPEPQLERGTALLRRLSLSSAAFGKQYDGPQSALPPSPPPNSAVSPTARAMPVPLTNKPRRSATVSNDESRPRRAPSPMGERILKGHFDGFN